MTKRCPICDELIDEHAKVCPYCDEKTGFEQESSKTSCPICGELISEDADICPFCGEDIVQQTNEENAENEIEPIEQEPVSEPNEDTEAISEIELEAEQIIEAEPELEIENEPDIETDLSIIDEITSNKMPCSVCGELINEDAEVCPYCGEDIVQKFNKDDAEDEIDPIEQGSVSPKEETEVIPKIESESKHVIDNEVEIVQKPVQESELGSEPKLLQITYNSRSKANTLLYVIIALLLIIIGLIIYFIIGQKSEKNYQSKQNYYNPTEAKQLPIPELLDSIAKILPSHGHLVASFPDEHRKCLYYLAEKKLYCYDADKNMSEPVSIIKGDFEVDILSAKLQEDDFTLLLEAEDISGTKISYTLDTNSKNISEFKQEPELKKRQRFR